MKSKLEVGTAAPLSPDPEVSDPKSITHHVELAQETLHVLKTHIQYIMYMYADCI